MNRESSMHLDYDQLLQALVDKADLGAEARAHLEQCPACQRQAQRLVQRYDRLGQMVKKMAPAPSRPIRIESRRPSARRWQFKPAMAFGVVAMLIFVFTVWWPQHTGQPGKQAPMVAQHLQDDDRLMEAIDALVDNALPEAYQQLAALSDDRPDEDLDEVIDWMVPPLEEEDEIEPAAPSRDVPGQDLWPGTIGRYLQMKGWYNA